MSRVPKDEPSHSHSCECDHASSSDSVVITETKPEPAGIPVFRIPTMDCAAEEGEIRHALAKLPGLRSLSFQLGARNAIKGLLDMTPEKAEVKQADGTWAESLVKTVAIGAIVRVKPGARVPLDGVIVFGTTSVDQSLSLIHI